MSYQQLTPAQCAAALALLAIGAALMLVAQRRNWRPSLALAIYTAVAMRLAILALAYRIQPWDLAHDFQTAGYNVLNHQDPILNARPDGWGYLPVYSFVLAGLYWLYLHLHVSWLIIARIPSILCDAGVVVLVGTVADAAGEPAALRRFQYACSPLAILVSGVHGQIEPACLLFSLAAFAIVLRAGPRVSGRRAATAGLLLGLAIATKTWPLLFAPALLLALPSWRRRAQFAAGAAGITALIFASQPFTVGTPVAKLRYITTVITGYHPSVSNWGWAGLWQAVHPPKLPVWQDPLWLNIASIGSKAAIAGMLLAVWWWRRAHPLDIATAATTALVAITPSFGTQYLLWQAPSATIRPTRLSMPPLQIVLGAYAALFYLPMNMLTWSHWRMASALMSLFSIGVAALMIAALPWRRRQWQPSPAAAASRAMRATDATAA
ncbi:MAG: DUF2029 domain-containing protein [Actinobacteria bacterium]|nr:DUF2029 domain-containing protein [Actinomycetota bacterium]